MRYIVKAVATFFCNGGGGRRGGNRSSTYLPSCKDKLTLVKFELSTPNT